MSSLTDLLLDLILQTLQEDHHDVEDAPVHLLPLVALPACIFAHLVGQLVHVLLLNQVVLALEKRKRR